MKENNFNFTVGSDIDFEDLIADIAFKNNLVALLTQEEGFENLQIRIYKPNDQEYWDFKLSEFEEVIQHAKRRLWELRRISDNKEIT